MKKTLLYSLAAFAALGLASCNDDYDDWASPQSYGQDEAAAKYGLSFAAGSEINSVLPDADGMVHLVAVSTTDASVSGYTIKTLTVNGDNINGTMVGNDICVSASDLEKLVEKQNDSRAAVSRPIEVKANVSMNLNNGDAVTTETVADVTGTVTPQPTPAIDEKGYFVLGAVQENTVIDANGNSSNWQLSKPVYMTANGDGTFTVHLTTTSDGDNYFKFYAGSYYDANSWDAVNQGQIGCETNGDASRHNFAVYQGDPLYTGGVQTPVIHGAGEWDVTLDMNNLTYTISPAEGMYYITGTPNSWSTNPINTMFYGEGNNVYSYTTYWTGAWDLKFWKKKDMGNWDAVYGTVKDGEGSESGTLINSKANAFQSPTAGYYTLTINMQDNTYKWTKLDNQSPATYTSVSLIGDFNSWGGDVDLEKLPAINGNDSHNWYVRYTVPATGGLKFRANHDWTTSWGVGAADKDKAIGDTYHLTPGSENINVPAGTYDFYLNDITGRWNIVPVK